jgi:hypothetical protein
MPKQQIPNPERPWDPDQTIERDPVRKRDPIQKDHSNDKDRPPPDRHRDPLRQPGELPDVQADVTADRRSGKDSDEPGADERTGPSAPHSSQRRKQ